MGYESRFPENDWKLLTHAPIDVWLGMCVVDLMVGSLEREYLAFGKGLAEARRRFEDSELVQAVAAQATAPTERQRRGHAAGTPDEILGRLTRVARAVDEHAEPAQAEAFKRMLVDFADYVARAASESVIDSYQKVSPAEECFLNRLRLALEL